MANKKSKNKSNSNDIAVNRSARYNFQVLDDFEAGMVLEGWEVKSLREGRCNIAESYAFLKNGEVFISNMNIQPLISASTHVNAEATRVRKLLLNRKEINHISGQINIKGLTLVSLKMYWVKGRAKILLGLAKGKNNIDKRQVEKNRDVNRKLQRGDYQ